ncbi:MAG: DAK2 domain-containing protein [Micrococcaceae bacterium]
MEWLIQAESALANSSDRLDAINIFPVPDGDTGTNLYTTIAAARAGLDLEDPSISTVGDALAQAGRAALDQARGNSGTLMAVALTGLSEPMRQSPRLTAPLLAQGLDRARTAAWSALSDPQEGTLLSVLTRCADASQDFLESLEDQSSDHINSRRVLALCCEHLVTTARSAVVATEKELAALTKAEVVDAGAIGLLLVLDALRCAVTGRPREDGLLEGLHGTDIQAPHLHSHLPNHDGHEVMCSMDLSPLDAATLRFGLDEIGDSVIMSPISTDADAQGRVRWRLHAHVPDVDTALDLVRRAGEPQNLVVTDLAGGSHTHHSVHTSRDS